MPCTTEPKLIAEGLSVAAGDAGIIKALTSVELALVPAELKALTTKKYVPAERPEAVQLVLLGEANVVYGPPLTVALWQL